MEKSEKTHEDIKNALIAKGRAYAEKQICADKARWNFKQLLRAKARERVEKEIRVKVRNNPQMLDSVGLSGHAFDEYVTAYMNISPYQTQSLGILIIYIPCFVLLYSVCCLFETENVYF